LARQIANLFYDQSNAAAQI